MESKPRLDGYIEIGGIGLLTDSIFYPEIDRIKGYTIAECHPTMFKNIKEIQTFSTKTGIVLAVLITKKDKV